MIRGSHNGDAAHAFAGLLPSGNLDTIRRSAAGQGSANVNNSGVGPWVRLTRAGNAFTWSASADGATRADLGTRTISMGARVQIGLATTAWDDAVSAFGSVAGDPTSEAFATFSNVTVTGNTTPVGPTYNALPAPATLAATPAPNGTAGNGNTSIRLNWAAVAGATGCRVERSVDGVSYAPVANAGAGVTTCTDVNPYGSMRWFYRVSAAASGTGLYSAPSPSASAVNRPNAPGPPGYTAPAIRFTNSLDLNLVDAQGETVYRVERSTDGGVTYGGAFNVAANETAFNLLGLASGTNYKVRVTPFNAAGDGPSLIFDGATWLGAPSNIRFTSCTPTALIIAWDATTAAAGYYVDRSTDGSNWANVATLGGSATTTYTDTNVTPGVEYYYRVVAFNAEGNGALSAVVYATPPAASLPAGGAVADVGTVNGGPGAGGGTASTGPGAWKLVSNGNDLLNAADSFTYAHRSLSGDGSIVARVDGVENTDGAAKAGLVLRQNLTPGSRSVAIVLNADAAGGIDVRTRTTANGGTGYQQARRNTSAPYWLRLVKTGNTVTTSYSANGTTWTTDATVSNFALSGTFFLGLGATAFSDARLNTSTFSNVAVSAAGAPTVAVAATASPGTVTGTTTSLGVLGADDGGEPALTYAWTASGPGAVTFSAANTNAARNVVATFTKAGTYTFTAAIADAGGLTATSTVNVTVSQTLTGIAPVGPSLAGLPVQITPRDQFGDAMTVGGATFSASNGFITPAGVLTSLPTAATSTVTAVVNGTTYTATVTNVGPRAWYKADAPSGTTLVDASGNNRNGTLTGSYGYAAGRINSGLSLTGGAANLPAGIVAGLNELTVAAWVNPTANVTWARVFDFGTGTDA